MKKIVSLCFILLASVGCEHVVKKQIPKDFRSLMGMNLPQHELVKTKKDFELLDFYEKLYEKTVVQKTELKETIPRVIHWIWVGPNSFPENSKKNIASWVELHPGWTFKFWTDRARPLPHLSMQMHLVSEFPFQTLEKEFYESDNYAEQADVLRYEILYQEGGIYVDHDVICMNSFETLLQSYDFFCGIEPLHAPIVHSSISVCNNLIATIPSHPTLKATIDEVKKRWEPIAQMYPGKDHESVIYRVAHRTFTAFDDATRNTVAEIEGRNAVFPAGYFNEIGGQKPLFAHHFYAATWYQTESKFENLVRTRLVKITKKNNQLLLVTTTLVGINLLLVAYLIFDILKKKKSLHKT